MNVSMDHNTAETIQVFLFVLFAVFFVWRITKL